METEFNLKDHEIVNLFFEYIIAKGKSIDKAKISPNNSTEAYYDVYLTGGLDNADPKKSIGGAISNTLLTDVVDTFWDSTSTKNWYNPITDYRVIAVKFHSSAKNVRLRFSKYDLRDTYIKAHVSPFLNYELTPGEDKFQSPKILGSEIKFQSVPMEGLPFPPVEKNDIVYITLQRTCASCSLYGSVTLQIK